MSLTNKQWYYICVIKKGLYGIKDEIKMPPHTNRPKGDKKLPIQLD